MYRVDAEMPFVYCGQCGAWGHRRTHHLSTECRPPTASGLQALRRIRGGLHPMQRRGAAGILLPRERVRTTARYDAQEGCWISVSRGRAGGDGIAVSARGGGAAAVEEAAGPSGALRVHVDEAETTGCGMVLDDMVDDVPMHEEMVMDVPFDHDCDYDVFGHGGSLENGGPGDPCLVIETTSAGNGPGDVEQRRG